MHKKVILSHKVAQMIAGIAALYFVGSLTLFYGVSIKH